MQDNHLLIFVLKECCGKGVNGCCAETNQNGTSTEKNGVQNVSSDC